MNNKIDHFGIGAASLEVGISALQAQLGVETPRGGKHDMMSTHNCVMQAGDESFLEILAIDPDAPPPGRARWFSMDDPATIARLAVTRARYAGSLAPMISTPLLQPVPLTLVRSFISRAATVLGV